MQRRGRPDRARSAADDDLRLQRHQLPGRRSSCGAGRRPAGGHRRATVVVRQHQRAPGNAPDPALHPDHIGAPARQRVAAAVRRLGRGPDRAGRVQGLPLPERPGRRGRIWYHDHAVHHTAENTYMGLAGLVHHRRGPRNLPLPAGPLRGPARRSRTRSFDTTPASCCFVDDGAQGPPGRRRPGQRHADRRSCGWSARKYLFRILNASTSRAYRLALSTGSRSRSSSVDGGLDPRPQQAARVPASARPSATAS